MSDAASRLADFRARRAAGLPLRTYTPPKMSAQSGDHENDNNNNNDNNSHSAKNNDNNDNDGYAEELRRGSKRSWSTADATEPATPIQQKPRHTHEQQRNTDNEQRNENDDDDENDGGAHWLEPRLPPASSFLASIRSRAPNYHYDDVGDKGEDTVETSMPNNLDLLPTPFVRYQDENGKPSQLKFRRLWWQPLTWYFSQLQWSNHTSGSNLAERRKRTSTLVELAIACHLLTCGAAAPNGASLLQAASVMRTAFYHFYRVHGLQINGKPNCSII